MIRRGGRIAALRRHVSQHVHDIIPKEAISDCSGVSKLQGVGISLVQLDCVIVEELGFADFMASRGRGVDVCRYRLALAGAGVAAGRFAAAITHVTQIPKHQRVPPSTRLCYRCVRVYHVRRLHMVHEWLLLSCSDFPTKNSSFKPRIQNCVAGHGCFEKGIQSHTVVDFNSAHINR
jgi:hypothetical protein